MGRAPLAYLTGWRMTLARDALVRPGATVASVAHEVGYANEFAFAAAFKRHDGLAPGRWRAGARARVASAAASAPASGGGAAGATATRARPRAPSRAQASSTSSGAWSEGFVPLR